jgi:mannose-6-phosphate isomerase-like protein (cupin superfamily)
VTHRNVDEIWYFLSGFGEVWRKDDRTETIEEVSVGVSLSIPAGTRFQFRNTGDEPIYFIIATIPPWPGADEAVPVPGCWQQ